MALSRGASLNSLFFLLPSYQARLGERFTSRSQGLSLSSMRMSKPKSSKAFAESFKEAWQAKAIGDWTESSALTTTSSIRSMSTATSPSLSLSLTPRVDVSFSLKMSQESSEGPFVAYILRGEGVVSLKLGGLLVETVIGEMFEWLVTIIACVLLRGESGKSEKKGEGDLARPPR